MPPALAQINKATPLIEVQNLTALLQTHSDGKDFGTPRAAMYQSQSGGVVDTLNKLLEDAQTQLGEASAEETAGIQAFEMLKRGLEGEIKFANTEMDDAKQSRSASE